MSNEIITSNADHNEFLCPNCHSDNIQKFEVAYANGTSIKSSNTVGVGLAKGGLGIGTAKTYSNEITTLGRQVSPPRRKAI